MAVLKYLEKLKGEGKSLDACSVDSLWISMSENLTSLTNDGAGLQYS